MAPGTALFSVHLIIATFSVGPGCAMAFAAGDFTQPFQVHAEQVPGTAVMAARSARIAYQAIDRPRGAEVRIVTTDPTAVSAVHAFLAFQRGAHHAAGHEAMP